MKKIKIITGLCSLGTLITAAPIAATSCSWQETHDVSINATEGGTVTLDRNGAIVNKEKSFAGKGILKGTKMTARVEPNEGYVFKNWEGKVKSFASGENEFTLLVWEDDIEITAVFEKEVKHNVSIKAGDGGQISVKVNNETKIVNPEKGLNEFASNLAEGTAMLVSIFPDKNHKFAGWSDNSVVIKRTDNLYVVIVRKVDINLTATFEASNDVSIKATEGGKVKVTMDGQTEPTIVSQNHPLVLNDVKAGTKITVEAMPDNDYVFDTWSVSNEEPQYDKFLNLKPNEELKNTKQIIEVKDVEIVGEDMFGKVTTGGSVDYIACFENKQSIEWWDQIENLSSAVEPNENEFEIHNSLSDDDELRIPKVQATGFAFLNNVSLDQLKHGFMIETLKDIPVSRATHTCSELEYSATRNEETGTTTLFGKCTFKSKHASNVNGLDESYLGAVQLADNFTRCVKYVFSGDKDNWFKSLDVYIGEAADDEGAFKTTKSSEATLYSVEDVVTDEWDDNYTEGNYGLVSFHFVDKFGKDFALPISKSDFPSLVVNTDPLVEVKEGSIKCVEQDLQSVVAKTINNKNDKYFKVATFSSEFKDVDGNDAGLTPKYALYWATMGYLDENFEGFDYQFRNSKGEVDNEHGNELWISVDKLVKVVGKEKVIMDDSDPASEKYIERNKTEPIKDKINFTITVIASVPGKLNEGYEEVIICVPFAFEPNPNDIVKQ